MKAIHKVKIKAHIQAIPQYLLVMSTLVLTAWITSKYLEALCFAITFCVLRYQVTDTLHCRNTLNCMLLTNGIVVLFIPVTLPLSNSLFGGLFAGFAVNYGASLIASDILRRQEQRELQALKEEKRQKNIYSMCENELRHYCHSYHLDPIDEEIVIQRLIYHLKGQQLYEKIGYSKPQMIRREKRIQSILNISLKDH